MIEDQKDKSDEYNPFEHRKVEKPNSDIRALANFVKASLGSGLLAGPLAFSNSGWALGIVGTIVIAFICAHCVHIFVTTSRGCCVLEKKPSMGYAETCEAAFANGPKPLRRFSTIAKLFAEFSLLSTYVGVCCIFTVIVAVSFKQLFDTYFPSTILPVQYYSLIFLVPICLLCQIRHLKYLAPFSLLANILLVITFAICLYYIFNGEMNVKDKRAVGDPRRFPAFLSTVLYAIEGMGVVMPVENAMKKPQHFLGCPSVLSVGMAIVATLYSTLGVLGYFRYGDELRGTITLNLPLDDWPAICAKVFIALSILFTFPLHFFVVIDTFTRYVMPRIKEERRNITQIIARAVIVCFCGAIGIALPMLEQIIGIVGAVFFSLLGLVIPGLVETVFRWNDLGKFNWILWKNIIIVFIGIFALVSGCMIVISDVINIERHEHIPK